MTKIKVAIVDDEKLIVEGMKMILEHDEKFQVTNVAQHGLELFDQINKGLFYADVILLDISMPQMDGMATLKKLNQLNLKTKIIALTSYYNDGMIMKFLNDGASAFLAKNEDPGEVIVTIKNVFEKGFYVNTYILDLIKKRRLHNRDLKLNESLTGRETEILKLICEEYTNKEIADMLFLSQRTVEGHRNRILEKIDCKNTAGMVIYAIENKIININGSLYK